MPLLNDAGADADKVYLGVTSVDAVYLGADKVWPPAPAGPRPYTWTDSNAGSHNPARSTPGMISFYDAHQIEINAVDGNGATLSLPYSGQLTMTNPLSGHSETLTWTQGRLLHGFWYLMGATLTGGGIGTPQKISLLVSGRGQSYDVTGPVEIELLP